MADRRPPYSGYCPCRASRSSAAFGTAGHAVLEQLALAHWHGDIPALARAASESHDLAATDLADLQARLEQIVRQMARITAGAKELLPEWPFALTLSEDGTTLIVDGTMDLLFHSADGAWHIIDYKFTNDEAGALLKKYGLQLNLYREALLRRAGRREDRIQAKLAAIRGRNIELIDVPPDLSFARAAIQAAVALDRQLRLNH